MKSALLTSFAKDGVDRVEFNVAFVEPFRFWGWLGTESDRQRDVLRGASDTEGRIRAAVTECGMVELYEGTTIESQETVDRDFQGSWFYRLR